MNRTQYFEMKTGKPQGGACAVQVVAGGIGGEGDPPLALCTVTLHIVHYKYVFYDWNKQFWQHIFTCLSA